MIGTIRFYNENKGFGFLVSRGGTRQHFFHVNDWLHEEIPIRGDLVEFSLKPSKRAGYPNEGSEIKKIGPSKEAVNALAGRSDTPDGQNGASEVK